MKPFHHFLLFLFFQTIILLSATQSAQAQTAQDYADAGELDLELNNYEKAISDYSIAITKDPMMQEAYYFRGLCRIRFKSH